MFRIKEDAKICGLCAGISHSTGIKVGIVRFLFIVGMIVTGIMPALLIYFGLCAIIPKKSKTNIANKKSQTIFNSFEQKGNKVVDKVINEIRTKISSEQDIKALEVSSNVAKVQEIVETIKNISHSILEKENSNPVVANIIDNFKPKIIEFENYSPYLEKQYLACISYLEENDIESLKSSISSLNEKIELSSQNVKKNYLNLLDQKQKRLTLLEEIKDYTDIIQSKLYLILDTLKNIEASVLHAELKTQMNDQGYDNLQSYISILTENMTEMSEIYQKTKMKL